MHRDEFSDLLEGIGLPDAPRLTLTCDTCQSTSEVSLISLEGWFYAPHGSTYCPIHTPMSGEDWAKMQKA